MPRPSRIDYPGAIRHVMRRGDRREPVFMDDVDRQDFLETLAQAPQKSDGQVAASVKNHRNRIFE